MRNREEIRLVGSGGQGVILASVILAEAAILAGKNAAQSQSYGPEARGGACMAQAVISNGDLGFPKVRVPSFLMALTEQSLEKYGRNLPEDTVILVDSSLEIPEWLKGHKVYQAPILQAAIDQVGKAMTANIVAVAVVNGNYAADAGLKAADALYMENEYPDNSYYCLIAVRSEDADNPVYQRIVEAYQSDAVIDVYNNQFAGFFTPTWKLGD